MRVAFVALALAVAVSGVNAKTSQFSWKKHGGRKLEAGPDACLTAMQSVLTCAGSWSGGDNNMPACCTQMGAVFSNCGGQTAAGVGTLLGSVTEVINRADTEIRPNATQVLLSFVGSCPRTFKYPWGSAAIRILYVFFYVFRGLSRRRSDDCGLYGRECYACRCLRCWFWPCRLLSCCDEHPGTLYWRTRH
jgi:hypothetical protein